MPEDPSQTTPPAPETTRLIWREVLQYEATLIFRGGSGLASAADIPRTIDSGLYRILVDGTDGVVYGAVPGLGAAARLSDVRCLGPAGPRIDVRVVYANPEPDNGANAAFNAVREQVVRFGDTLDRRVVLDLVDILQSRIALSFMAAKAGR